MVLDIMEFDKSNIDEFYTTLKTQDGFPQSYINQLFLIAKITDEADIKAEIVDLLSDVVEKDVLKVLKNRGKVKLKDGQFVLSSLLSYAKQSVNIPVGELYTMLGYSRLNFYKADVLKKLNANPDLIARFDGVKTLWISRETYAAGVIPDSIGELSSLEKLEIEGSFSEIPSSIAQLQNLKKLDIKLGYLKEIPEAIKTMSNLDELRISGGGNSLSKEYNEILQLPLWLDEMSGLKSLEISYLYTNEIPEKLPPNLERLEIFRMPYVTQLPQSICDLKKLKCFEVFVCKELSSLPEGLGQSVELEELQLGTVPKIKDLDGDLVFSPSMKVLRIPDEIVIGEAQKQISPKKELRIQNASYLRHILNNPELFPNLTELKVSGISNFEGQFCFEQLSNLEILELNQIKESKRLLDSIAQCTKLKQLIVRNLYLTKVPDDFSEMGFLQKLTIGSCENLSLDSSDLPDITDIHIYGVKDFAISASLKNVENLFIGSSDIQNIVGVGEWNSLKKLDISLHVDNTVDGNEYLDKLPESFSCLIELQHFLYRGKIKQVNLKLEKLESLYIEGHNNTYASGGKSYPIIEIGECNLPSLRKLVVNNCNGNELGNLLGKTPILEQVEFRHLYGCGCFPEVDLPQLREIDFFFSDVQNLDGLSCDNLQSFKAIFCENLDDDAINTITGWKCLKSLIIDRPSKSITSLPERLSSLKLEELGLSHFAFEEIPGEIGEMETLQRLYLDGYHIDGLPNSIAQLENLKQLSIESTWFRNPLPEAFAQLKLKELKMFMSKYGGNNMKKELYENLLTPNFTKIVRMFSDLE